MNDAVEVMYPATGALNAAVRHVAENSGALRSTNDSVSALWCCLWKRESGVCVCV